MKRIITIFIIIFSLILSCGNNNEADNNEVDNKENSFENLEIAKNTENIKNKVVYVGIDAGFPPFGYLDNGHIAGFDYDMMNEIARLSDMEVEFTYMPFAKLLSALQTKKIDVIIAAMTVTEERKQFVNFSTPYYVSSQIILVHKYDNSITNFGNLGGKNVGVIMATTGDAIITQNGIVNTKKFDTIAEAVLSLKENNIDAILFDKEPCKNFAKNNEDIRLIENDSIRQNYAIAVRKDENSLLENINNGISIIMTNGTYEKLIDKNFK